MGFNTYQIKKEPKGGSRGLFFKRGDYHESVPFNLSWF